MKKIQNLTTVKLFAVPLVATLLFAAGANAQMNAYAGKFTLPHEVRWGLAVLPAGDYRFTLSSATTWGMILVRSSDLKTAAFVSPKGISSQKAKAPSALVIETRGNESAVRSLRLDELHLVLDFGSEKGHGRKAIEQARATQEVPVLVAKR